MISYFEFIIFMESLFDLWSIVHFAFYLFLGASLVFITTKWRYLILVITACGVMWELFEHFIARPYINGATNEVFMNSWVGDLVSNFIGGIIGFIIGLKAKKENEQE